MKVLMTWTNLWCRCMTTSYQFRTERDAPQGQLGRSTESSTPALQELDTGRTHGYVTVDVPKPGRRNLSVPDP
jgi:hypothetical protein